MLPLPQAVVNAEQVPTGSSPRRGFQGQMAKSRACDEEKRPFSL